MKKPPQKKEITDFSVLPKANPIISSLMIDSKNPEKKLKLFEIFFKVLAGDPLFHFITREHIIDYAKNNGIFTVVEDNKKGANNNKDANNNNNVTVAKDISPEQLSKACLGLINERSVSCRTEKKVIVDKINEAKKLKEDSEKYWKNIESNAKKDTNDNVNNTENNKNVKEKKDKKKDKNDKNEVVPPKPEEIEVPVYDEYTNEMFVILYNYPLSEEELTSLLKETNEFNDKITINLFEMMKDIDPYEEPKKEEVVLDKKGKPIQPKEQKIDKDTAEMLRYFNSTLVLPPHPKVKKEEELNQDKQKEAIEVKEEQISPKISKDAKGKNVESVPEIKPNIDDDMEPTPLILSDVYNRFIELKNSSLSSSPLRLCLFNTLEFSLEPENEREEKITEMFRNFLIKIAKMHAQITYYSDWKKQKKVIEINEKEGSGREYKENEVEKLNAQFPIYTSCVSQSLLSFASNLSLEKRMEKDNQYRFRVNDFENLFSKKFNKYSYMYSNCDDKTNGKESGKGSADNSSNNNLNNKENSNSNNANNKENSYNNSNGNNVIDNTNNNDSNNNKDNTNDIVSNMEMEKEKEVINIPSIEPIPKQMDVNTEIQLSNKSIPKESNNNKNTTNINTNNNSNIKYNESHLIRRNNEIIESVHDQMKKCNDISSPFSLLINYHDKIYKENLELKLNGDYLYKLTKTFNLFLIEPSIRKCLIQFSNKSNKDVLKQRGKKNELYPYLTSLSLSCLSKYQELRFFESMLESKCPERKIDLSSKEYEEYLSKDEFMQELAKIRSRDMEIFAMNDERTGNTMVVAYYRCPKGRVFRKQKKIGRLSMPDLETFLGDYAPEFKIKRGDDMNKTVSKLSKNSNPGKKQGANDKKNQGKANANTSKIMEGLNKEELRFTIEDKNNNNETSNLKLNLEKDKENVNSSSKYFYLADDLRVGEPIERIKYMFPADGGIFVKKLYLNGIYNSTYNYIIKDDVIFGIRKNEDDINEMWVNFDEDLKITFTYRDNYEPYFKNSEEPIDSNNGTFVTFTLNDGLIVQIQPNGDIMQKHIKNNENTDINSTKERYRLISSKSVISVFPLETRVLSAEGEVSVLQNGTLHVGEESILFSERRDPDMGTWAKVREDGVLSIAYPDNSRYVEHSDHTKIYTSATVKEVTKYIIEHNDFAPVEITYDQVKKRTKTTIAAGSTEALMGSDNIMNRSCDGRVSKVTLPNKTVITVFKEKKSTEEFETYEYNTVVLIYRLDGTVIRASQMGDIVLITSGERKRLNSEGRRLDFSKLQDTDYLFELNGKPSERKAGAYTCDLRAGRLWTRDGETNVFDLLSNGGARCKVEGTTIAEMNEKNIEEMGIESPRFEGTEYLNPEVRFSETPKDFVEPRCFVIDNWGSKEEKYVKEYLSEKQIENFKRNISKLPPNEIIYNVKPYADERNMLVNKAHTWIIKQLDEEEKYKNLQILDKIVKFPRRNTPMKQTFVRELYPKKEIYIVRKINQTPPITEQIRKEIEYAEINHTKYVQNSIKPEMDKIDPQIIKMNRDFQRRYIIEKMSKQEENDHKIQEDKTIESNEINTIKKENSEINQKENDKKLRYINL